MPGEPTILSPGDPALAPAPGDVAAARSHVERVVAAAPGDHGLRERFLALLDGHSTALERTCRPGHLTASALVLSAQPGEVLVLWHNKARRWLQPGGHADGDGNLAHVAWREATEETGVEGLRIVVPAVHLDIHEFLPPDEDPHLHFDVRFVALAPKGAVPRGNHESAEVRWVGVDALDALGVDGSLRDLAERGCEEALREGYW
jgi:8-oxo-dGTP pyrophosphatase MutT (NUDIX family)